MSAAGGGARRDRFLVAALFGFLGLLALLRIPQMVYPDLIFTYPFITVDGFEWIAEANHYLEHDLVALYRNPGLPLVIAGLKAVGLERFLPALLVLLHLGFLGLLYGLVRQHFACGVACFTTLCFSFCFRIQNLFDVVLADGWAISLQAASMVLLLRSQDRPSNLIGAALLAGLSFNFQYAAAVLLPAYAYFVFVGLGPGFVRDHRREVTIALVLGLAVATPQLLHLVFEAGSLFPASKDPTPFFGLHLYGLFPYAVNYLAFLGIPFAFVVGLGVVPSLADPRPQVRFFHLVLFGNFVFWILLYEWIDTRFLVYFVPCWAFYFAYAVERFEMLRFFDPRRVPVVVSLLAIAVTFWGIKLAGDQEPQSRKDLLPIAPQVAFTFPTEPNPEHPANRTIGLRGTELRREKVRAFWAPFTGHYSFYRNMRAFAQPERAALREDLLAIAAFLASAREGSGRIELCGTTLSEDPRLAAQMRHRTLDTLRHNVDTRCPGLGPQLFRVGDVEEAGTTILFEGSVLSLRSPPAS